MDQSWMFMNWLSSSPLSGRQTKKKTQNADPETDLELEPETEPETEVLLNTSLSFLTAAATGSGIDQSLRSAKDMQG